MSGAWKNSFDNLLSLPVLLPAAVLPPGYFTAAGHVFHTAALFIKFSGYIIQLKVDLWDL